MKIAWQTGFGEFVARRSVSGHRYSLQLNHAPRPSVVAELARSFGFPNNRWGWPKVLATFATDLRTFATVLVLSRRSWTTRPPGKFRYCDGCGLIDTVRSYKSTRTRIIPHGKSESSNNDLGWMPDTFAVHARLPVGCEWTKLHRC